jgi:hypothetical protein
MAETELRNSSVSRIKTTPIGFSLKVKGKTQDKGTKSSHSSFFLKLTFFLLAEFKTAIDYPFY